MDSLVITWREVLVVIILVLAVYVAEILFFIRSGGQRRRITLWRRGEPGSVAPAKDNRRLLEAIEDLRHELSELRTEVETLKAMQASGNSPYAQAIEMAKEGHDVGEVAVACGISRGEAELIVAVHRGDGP